MGFLWQGGKVETKKCSLVKWGQVTQPYEKQGLAIRLPGIMNLGLRLKMTWIFITRESSWWEKILKEKYIKHNRILLLEKGFPIRPCSQV